MESVNVKSLKRSYDEIDGDKAVNVDDTKDIVEDLRSRNCPYLDTINR